MDGYSCAWYDVIEYGMVRYDMVRNGVVYRMVCLVSHGAGN